MLTGRATGNTNVSNSTTFSHRRVTDRKGLCPHSLNYYGCINKEIGIRIDLAFCQFNKSYVHMGKGNLIDEILPVPQGMELIAIHQA